MRTEKIIMRYSKRDTLGIVLIFLAALVSSGAWYAFFSTGGRIGLTDSGLPFLWFLAAGMIFFFGAAVWEDRYFRIAGAIAVFAPGIFFSHSGEYVTALAIAGALAFQSATDIAREFRERWRFRFFKSVRAGAFAFIVALSLALSSGYYGFLKSASWEELVPRFRVGEEMTMIVFKVVSVLNPEFAALSEEELTVDEFLLSMERDRSEAAQQALSAILPLPSAGLDSAIPLELTGSLKEAQILAIASRYQEQIARELYLISGREQIAELAGRSVRGDERIADVLSAALQQKVIVVLKGQEAAGKLPVSAFPFFLSLLLFLTLLSLFSLLSLLSILGAQMLFSAALRLRWLELILVPGEKEVLKE